MLKKWSDEGLVFLTIVFILGMVLAIPWSVILFLHYRYGFKIDPSPNTDAAFGIGVLFIFTGLYALVWFGFFLFLLGRKLHSTLVAMRDRSSNRPSLALWAVFVAIAVLVYIEGKGKVW